jgi:hypothetical protein
MFASPNDGRRLSEVPPARQTANNKGRNMDVGARDQIIAECTRLSSAFAYHLDHRNYRELAELFAADGVWVRHGVRLEGRAAIIAALEERPASQFTRHLTLGHHFTHVDSARAASVAYNLSIYSMEAAVLPATYVPEQAMLLDFIDTYTKTPEGWRFALRDTPPVLISADARARMSGHA